MAAAPPFKKKGKDHAWSVSDFEIERPSMTRFVRDKLLPLLHHKSYRRILIRAPVKSGKREIVEYIAQRDHSYDSHRVHAFISAWHRTADEDQRRELELHNMKVFSITDKDKATHCVEWIEKQIAEGKEIILHLDECDYGAGARQILGSIYTTFHDNASVTFLLYSATPQEVLFSGEVEEKGNEEYGQLLKEIKQSGACVEYCPPEGFCGPTRFLEEGLIFDAEPFFVMAGNQIQLTSQGTQILSDFHANLKDDSSRNIVVLRLSSGDGGGKENKHIYQFLRHASNCKELESFIIIVAKDENNVRCPRGRALMEIIQWSSEDYWKCKAKDIPIIIAIDQTAGRSTEWVCHDRIFAYHDFRNEPVYTTISQAQERVNHYEQRYGEFQRIRVYGHKKTFELSAGRINYDTYMNNEWYKRKVTGEELYVIKRAIDHSIHPEYSSKMTSDNADDALKKLGSFVRPKVAARVKGKIAESHVIHCKFVACTEDTFPKIKEELEKEFKELFNHTIKNPFIPSKKKGLVEGRWQGRYEEGYSVLDYSYIHAKPGWGLGRSRGTYDGIRFTICYQDDTLGIAVRWMTDELKTRNTLQTHKSMYHD